jgi:nucleoside-diphosphate-sugar epimerase
LYFNQSTILPSNQTPLGSLPSRFRRERVLIVGCGDVGMRVAQQLSSRVGLLALTSDAGRVKELRSRGITPLLGNLDHARSLMRLAGIATRVVHLAPPPSEGWVDSRTQALLRALRLRQRPICVVYGSTSGVYGNCDGDWVTEVRASNAHTPRAHRRVDAESRIRFWGRSTRTRVNVLRIPGIYAQDRDGGTPRARLLKATPVLRQQDDVFTNHIHADDLARACCLTLWRGAPQRVYNVNDDSSMKMGDYFDLAADLYGLPRPPRIAREGATEQLPLMLLSFMSESRRMDNTRMKQELRLRLHFPNVLSGLR